jgi:hypothetical protein
MARKTNTDPFDFSKARGSSGRTAFRTPMMSPTSMPKTIRPRFDSDSMSLGAVSPYRALAFYFAKLARAGIQGADEFSALNSAASRSATVARRIGAVERQAPLGSREAQSIVADFTGKNPAGYSSKLFEEGVRQLFRPTEVDAILRSFAKLSGAAGTRLAGYGPTLIRTGAGTQSGVATAVTNAITAGRVLRGATRK